VEGRLATPFALAGRRCFVAGHRGMVGQALCRRLEGEGATLLTVGRERVDLRRQVEAEAWIDAARPEVIFLAAATVGGILANDRYPADFLYDNLAIEANVVEAARQCGVAKLVLLGSSCIYPRAAPQPMAEEALLTGPLEPTNQWYAVAKIAGIKLGQAYRRQHGLDAIAVMPTNLYGPGDDFELQRAHVVPALLRKIHEAKRDGLDSVEIWGSGRPRREFLHVDDCADAVVHLCRHYSGEAQVNVGCGEDVTIAALAEIIAGVVGWQGRFVFDPGKPDGAPQKLLDATRLTALGWRPRIGLAEGLRQTYDWYRAQADLG